MIRATAAYGQIRAFAATVRDTAETARQLHNTSPVITAALGRTLAAAAMMGAMMKGEDDLLTIRFEGDGPAGIVLATADSAGHVKGYAANPQVMLPPTPEGKLDVGCAIGFGRVIVMKDIGMKEPYVGQTDIVSGEIAEDLTYYFAVSEQTPSSVGLGVLMNQENTVRRAGGFIIQLMPDVTEEIIEALEKKLADLAPVTAMLDQGMTPEDILNEILEGLEPEILDRMPVEFTCNCSKERFARGITSIQKEDIREMADAGENIEVCCQFCNKKYYFTPDELREML